MALKFGEFPLEGTENTIILAAGTINGVSGCDTEGYSFIRQVDRLDEVRDGESVFIVNKDKDINIIVGEYQKDGLIINQQMQFLTNVDFEDLSKDSQGMHNKTLGYSINKSFDEDGELFSKYSVCIINIDNDTDGMKFTKVNRKSINKVTNDMLKAGINIVASHQPSMNLLDVEVFMFEIIAVINRDNKQERYILYCDVVNGANREKDSKDRIAFKINNNRLVDEVTIFEAVTVNNSYNPQNDIVIDTSTGSCIQSQIVEKDKVLIIEKEEQYKNGYAYQLSFLNTEIDADGRLDSSIFKKININECKYMNKEFNQNQDELTKLIKKYYRGEYYCIDLHNMHKMRFESWRNQSRDKEYLLLGFEDRKLIARIFEVERNSDEIRQIDEFEVSMDGKIKKEISRDNTELLNIPNNVLNRDNNFDKEF